MDVEMEVKKEPEDKAGQHSGTTNNLETAIVDWESGDVEDSMNWPPRQKWLTMGLVSMLALVT